MNPRLMRWPRAIEVSARQLSFPAAQPWNPIGCGQRPRQGLWAVSTIYPKPWRLLKTPVAKKLGTDRVCGANRWVRPECLLCVFRAEP